MNTLGMAHLTRTGRTIAEAMKRILMWTVILGTMKNSMITPGKAPDTEDRVFRMCIKPRDQNDKVDRDGSRKDSYKQDHHEKK